MPNFQPTSSILEMREWGTSARCQLRKVIRITEAFTESMPWQQEHPHNIALSAAAGCMGTLLLLKAQYADYLAILACSALFFGGEFCNTKLFYTTENRLPLLSS